MEKTICIFNRYLCHTKKGKDINLNLKSVTMIDSIRGCFKITQYNNKNDITIVNLVETTWLTRYPWPKKSRMTKDQNLLVMSSKITN